MSVEILWSSRLDQIMVRTCDFSSCVLLMEKENLGIPSVDSPFVKWNIKFEHGEEATIFTIVVPASLI